MMSAFREHTEPLPSWVSLIVPAMVLIAVFGGWAGFVIAGALMQ